MARDPLASAPLIKWTRDYPSREASRQEDAGMKRNLWLFAMLLVFGVSSPSRAANIKDGNDLLDACRDADKGPDEMKTQDQLRRSMMCLGYITGVTDGIKVATQVNERVNGKPLNLGEWGGMFCIPDGVKVGQMLRVVVKYLRDHPEELHNDSAELVVAAFLTAFPCKVENERKPSH